jgi:hypothetical protein
MWECIQMVCSIHLFPISGYEGKCVQSVAVNWPGANSAPVSGIKTDDV